MLDFSLSLTARAILPSTGAPPAPPYPPPPGYRFEAVSEDGAAVVELGEAVFELVEAEL